MWLRLLLLVALFQELQSKHGIKKEHVQSALDSVFGAGSDLATKPTDDDQDLTKQGKYQLLQFA